ncbi:hypothetical protein GLOIN_2v1787971 [Rhizophagus clarus]|nr:hypothetical protein GLOIN_2v1787971 [Rhizophagus clarus]
METYKRPLFNYINYWKYLDLYFLERLISSKKIEKSKVSNVRNEIIKLFINNNTNFIHFSIPQYYQPQHVFGDELCFAELESFQCDSNTNQDILKGLARICKSIKKLRFNFDCESTDISGFIELIDAQKNLNDVNFINTLKLNKSFCKLLEELVIKHADTVQYLRISWEPITKFLSYFVNLLCLEVEVPYHIYWNWNNESLSLPNLKILKARRILSEILVDLIKNTVGNLSEVSIFCSGVNDKRLIQVVYQNCPNLKYFKISLASNVDILISELENLLNHCQLLNGLIINICDAFNEFNWVKFFEILAKSSPIGLFKFKFSSDWIIKLEDVKFFFDNWEGRNSLSLITNNHNYTFNMKAKQQLEELFKEYKTKGIVKNYFIGFNGFYTNIYEDFIWT